MIKVITCIKRKPGMSVEDFQAYWRTDHAEVVKGLPNLRRYIQSHALPGGYRKGELPYDGIAEIWVDDVDTLRANAGGAAYEAIQRDEENFIDRPNMATILTQEYIIKDSPIPKGAVKNIEFVPRKTGMEVAQPKVGENAARVFNWDDNSFLGSQGLRGILVEL